MLFQITVYLGAKFHPNNYGRSGVIEQKTSIELWHLYYSKIKTWFLIVYSAIACTSTASQPFSSLDARAL